MLLIETLLGNYGLSLQHLETNHAGQKQVLRTLGRFALGALLLLAPRFPEKPREVRKQ